LWGRPSPWRRDGIQKAQKDKNEAREEEAGGPSGAPWWGLYKFANPVDP
jgi:hypothetical protein